ncbi:glycosyltransferase [Seminavis robusta]|uniref:Glycosyltransferase n=1 Tax=Seminavis robusta TaxID=568900 RepID=A0A9N8E6Y7_9STRA|nr:glycosyltransferase [Seminavis robusta]|eukprot:Sro717_g192070.1 glycosyltransferase (428) ;mRNA; f:39914-41278
MAEEITAAPASSRSPRQGSGIRWKSVAVSGILFVTMTTVTHNTKQLNPIFLNQLTDHSNEVIRQLQATVTETIGNFSDYENITAILNGEQDEQQDNHIFGTLLPKPKRVSRHQSLYELTRSSETPECPSDLKAVEIISNPEADAGLGRKIPKIVHMTGKTKCLTGAFYDASKLWQFENHSYYFHDDQAVEELFNKDWPMFPQLKNTIACLQQAGGAAMADLWRYLALYEYGGIYTDMDNHPNTLFNAGTIQPETDAYFLQEGGGFLSQYFFAVSPRHPLMFLAVHDVMREMHNILDTGNFYVPVISGPGAMKRAFLNFMGLNGTNLDLVAGKYSKPSPGHYEGVGFGNHSVTVFAHRRNNNDYVIRSAISGHRKMQGWRQMNITNYQAMNKQPNGKSCARLLHEKYYSHAASFDGEIMQEVYRRQRW